MPIGTLASNYIPKRGSNTMGKSKISKIPFKGTPEQERELRDILAELKDQPGALMPAMQKAQDIYGYLPIEVQTIIAECLNVPVEEVYGVATFYAQFALNPKGKYTIGVCLGTACYVKGSQDIFDKCSEILGIKGGEITNDGKFSLEATRCIGCCGLAPVMTVNDDVYGKITAADVAGILQKYN